MLLPALQRSSSPRLAWPCLHGKCAWMWTLCDIDSKLNNVHVAHAMSSLILIILIVPWENGASRTTSPRRGTCIRLATNKNLIGPTAPRGQVPASRRMELVGGRTSSIILQGALPSWLLAKPITGGDPPLSPIHRLIFPLLFLFFFPACSRAPVRTSLTLVWNNKS